MIVILLGTYVVLGTVDAWQTYRCLRDRTCREANPSMRWLMDRVGVAGALAAKVTFHVAFCVSMLRLRDVLPPLAVFGVIGAGVIVQTLVVHHNARLRRIT